MMGKRGVFLFFVLIALACARYAPAGELIVSSVGVSGNARIPSNEILSAAGIREGEPLQAERIREGVRAIFARGDVENVRVEQFPENGGAGLVFHVEEKPVVTSVSFKGNRAFSGGKLAGAAGLAPGDYYEGAKVREAAERIARFYREAGFPNPAVEGAGARDEDGAGMAVEFSVDEGSRVRMVSVGIEGNEFFTDRRIRRQIKTGSRGIIRREPFNKDVLEEDVQRIAHLYHGQGFIDVAVSVEKLEYERNRALVSIRVEEGPRYFVRGVEFPEELDGVIRMKEGDAFSPDELRMEIRRGYDYLYDRGYLYSEVRAERSIDRAERKTDVVFSVFKGPVVRVERIRISGNTQTRDDVIRREITIKPGDVFELAKVRESHRRIRNLGKRQPFFESVTFEIEEGTAPDRKDLHFKVKEGKTGSILFGAGYSSDDKFIGFVEAHVDNFDIANIPSFTGAGQDISIRGEWGAEKTDYTLSFTEPWLFDIPLSFGIDLYDRMREWIDYDERRDGGRIRLGYPLGEGNRLSLAYKREKVGISGLGEGVSPDIIIEKGENILSTLTTGIVRDTRDSVFDPRSGGRSSFTAEVAGGGLGGDKDFVKYVARTSYYFPSWGASALNLRLEGGYVSEFGDSEHVPVYERFYLGGADTVRGYRYRGIGPKDDAGRPVGGNVRLMANLEYIIPLVRDFKGAVFFDTGNVWASSGDIALDELVSGVGIGIRIASPVGPLRLDYAYGIDTKQTRVHFTLGWPF